MKYHVLINLTKFNSIKSHTILNNIVKKYLNNDCLDENENNIFCRIKSYAIIILIDNKNILNNFYYIGKYFVIKNQNEISDVENNYNDFLMCENIINPNGHYCVRLSGGLGNQLFMCLSIFAFANKNDRKFSIQNFSINKHSKTKYDTTIFKKFCNNNVKCKRIYVEEKDKHLDYIQLPQYTKNNNVLYTGYFQNSKYLENIKYDIMNLLNFDCIDIEKYEHIFKICINSCFVHVRLGDYCKHQSYGFLNKSYYDNCICEIIKKYNDGNIFIVTNEPRKIYDYVTFNKNILLLDNKYDEIETLLFMIYCNNGGAISNSTYSWWGGYLNSLINKTNIIIPHKFMANIDKTIEFDNCKIIGA